MQIAPSVLWELRGRSGKAITCVLQSDHNLYRLTVTMGAYELHGESFKGEADALTQSAFLLNDFVGNGWTEIYRRDP